jgi:hypothetical protein
LLGIIDCQGLRCKGRATQIFKIEIRSGNEKILVAANIQAIKCKSQQEFNRIPRMHWIIAIQMNINWMRRGTNS